MILRATPVVDVFYDLASEETNECVEWPLAVDKNGYGQISQDGTTHKVHRVALALRSRPPSRRHHAAHGPCHNPRCMNYRHLSWKTSSDNQYDRLRDGTDCRGEKHGRAILTEQDVVDMRRRHADGEAVSALAREYGVSRSAAKSAITGRTWSWLQAA